MISAGSVHAKLTMAVALVKHLLVAAALRLFGRRRTGAPWLRRIAAEGLAHTPTHAWEYLAESSRCIGCGFCDAVVTLSAPCSQGGSHPSGSVAPAAAGPLGGPRRPPTPSEWILGAPRRPEDAAVVAGALPELERACEAIAAVCPARLDARVIVRLVRERAAALEGASASLGASDRPARGADR